MISDDLRKYLSVRTYFSKLQYDKMISEKKESFEPSLSASSLIEKLLRANFRELINLACDNYQKEITPKNIPQFSNIEDGTTNLVSSVYNEGDYGIGFVDLDLMLRGKKVKEMAHIKYGENHAKLAQQLDLVYIIRRQSCYVYLTDIGRELTVLPEKEQKEVVTKLMIFIPIIQFAIKKADNGENFAFKQELLQFLKGETAIRRAYSCMALVDQIKDYIAEDDTVKEVLNRISL